MPVLSLFPPSLTRDTLPQSTSTTTLDLWEIKGLWQGNGEVCLNKRKMGLGEVFVLALPPHLPGG